VFSTEPTSLGTVLHETGHSPFGLADESCCDGGYWEQSVHPNLHNTLAGCQADAPRLRRLRLSPDRLVLRQLRGPEVLTRQPSVAAPGGGGQGM
jgi:hypothetical protein